MWTRYSGTVPETATPGEDPSTGELLTRVARWLHGRSRARLAPLGLTPAAVRALGVVGRHEPVRMADLAAALRVVPRSATTTVDLLAEAGLVERVPDPADRRAVRVRLTGAGRSQQAALRDERRRAAEELLAVLPEADRAQLHALLVRVDAAAGAAWAEQPAR
ncbi:hypothetical protein GCM10027047_03730 [Rhodococcus aerolatus]